MSDKWNSLFKELTLDLGVNEISPFEYDKLPHNTINIQLLGVIQLLKSTDMLKPNPTTLRWGHQLIKSMHKAHAYSDDNYLSIKDIIRLIKADWGLELDARSTRKLIGVIRANMARFGDRHYLVANHNGYWLADNYHDIAKFYLKTKARYNHTLPQLLHARRLLLKYRSEELKKGKKRPK